MFWLLWEPLLQSSVQTRLAPRSSRESAAAEISPWLDPFGDQVCCVLTQYGDCLQLSPNWESLTGLKHGACLGRLFIQRLHPDFQPKLIERLLAARPDSSQKIRCQFAHADGSWHWYDLSLCPADNTPPERLRGSQSELEKNQHYLCVMRNISGEVQTHKVLQKAQIEAELALKGRSDFLANMSHELRTPLNAIMGFSQIMEKEMFGKVGSKRYLDYVNHIRESGDLLLARINELLEISDLESAPTPLKETETSLKEIIRGAVEKHSHRAFSAKVNIHEELLSGDVKLYVDRVRITQAIANVLSNAVKFSRKGGNVTLRAKLNSDKSISITVIDKGKGIPQKHLDNICNILAEENSLFALNRESLGLGLVIAKEMVALHQGRISIDSKLGEGTKVTIFLPSERVLATKPKSRPKKVAQAAH